MVTSRRTRLMGLIRVAITFFVVLLLTVVTLGWIWTGSHQPPPLRTASHVVLGIAAVCRHLRAGENLAPDRVLSVVVGEETRSCTAGAGNDRRVARTASSAA